jgi:hypothetical protein
MRGAETHKLKKNRWNWLVEPKIQGKIVMLVAAVNLLALSSYAMGVKYYFARYVQKAQEKGLPEGHLFYEYLSLQEQDLWRVYGLVVAGTLVVSVLFSLYYSHRFVGPFQRVRRTLDEYVKTGQWQDLKFRDGDYMQEVGESLNQAIRRGQS